jgi:hypothetical protein
MMKDKKGESPILMWIFGISAVLITLNLLGVSIPFLGAAKGGTVGGAPGGVITVNVTGQQCNVDSTTVTFGNVEDKYWGNKITFPYHRWYLAAKGSDEYVDQGTVADGTTRTLSPGDKVKVYYGLNNSATSHYGAFAQFEVPCSGAFTSATADSVYKDAYKLYNMTRGADFVANVNNQNGAVNAAGTPQSITAGQVRKMKFELNFPNKAAYGAPAGPTGKGPAVLVMCILNNTYWDSEGFTMTSGKELYAGPIPQRISVVAGHTIKAWEYNAQETNGQVTDTLNLDADDTVPATSTSSNVNCTLVDKAWYMPTQSNIPAFGYESDTQTDVGSVDLSFLFRTNGTG